MGSAYQVPPHGVPSELFKSQMAVWDAALEAGTQHGYKNGQVTDFTGPLLSLMRSTFQGVVSTLTVSWQGLPQEAATNGGGGASRDPRTVVEPLTRLKRLLETDDGEAADFMIDARSQLAGVLTAAEIETLSELVGDFNFESALKCLSSITDRLSLNLK